MSLLDMSSAGPGNGEETAKGEVENDGKQVIGGGKRRLKRRQEEQENRKDKEKGGIRKRIDN
jgi:hypothetical protein